MAKQEQLEPVELVERSIHLQAEQACRRSEQERQPFAQVERQHQQEFVGPVMD
jgi:hypothetical protein